MSFGNVINTMQTFLTSDDFIQSARDLDRARAVKNLLEVRQLMDSYIGKAPSIFHSPAAQMWVDSPTGLYEYAQAMIADLQRRGYKTEKNAQAIEESYAALPKERKVRKRPFWWDDENIRAKVIRTHRASLWRKAPHLYPSFEVDNNTHAQDICCETKHKNSRGQQRGPCSYYWPTHIE